MAAARVIDGTGAVTGERELPADLFGGRSHPAVVHQVVTAQLAAARAGTASTKRRSEVRGGGRKPWRQKGTGRARQGSIRSPLWVGGGSVFGPKPRSYVQRVNKKMRKAALRSVLAAKAEAGSIFVLEGWQEPKTRAAANCLRTADIEGKVLIVLDPESPEEAYVDRAFRNLAGAAFSLHGSLSAYDALAADAIVFTSGAFERFAARSQAGDKG
jgi:large subunit ribosomal protein L4